VKERGKKERATKERKEKEKKERKGKKRKERGKKGERKQSERGVKEMSTFDLVRTSLNLPGTCSQRQIQASPKIFMQRRFIMGLAPENQMKGASTPIFSH
jgi:hypothetical protein